MILYHDGPRMVATAQAAKHIQLKLAPITHVDGSNAISGPRDQKEAQSEQHTIPLTYRPSAPITLRTPVTSAPTILLTAQSISPAANNKPQNDPLPKGSGATADADIAQAQDRLWRVTQRYQIGMNTHADVLDAAIGLAEARVRAAIVKKQLTDLGADLDSIVAQRQQLLSDAHAKFEVGVVDTREVNKNEVALAEARVSAALYDIVKARQASLSEATARYKSGVAAAQEEADAEAALQKAERAFAESVG